MKKVYYLQIVLMVFLITIMSPFTHSQKIIQSPIKGITSSSNFYEIRNEMDNYWNSLNVENGYKLENGVKSKVPNWKLYKRWEYYWEQRVDQQTGDFPTTNSVTEYEKYLKNNSVLSKVNYDENWTNLGTNSSGGGYAGIGRINCIAFHPTDLSTFWVGSPSGGIWKTTDGGSNWTILNDDQSVLGVSDIAVDYTNPDILYIATGDRDGGSMWSLSGGQRADNNSTGILKTTNGGATWNTTGLTYSASQRKLVYSLVIHPVNSSILLASTTDGVYKSVDSGTNWYLTTNSYPCWRLAFKPGNPSVIYGTEIYSGNQYFDLSTDTGETWNGGTFFGSGSDARRTELAVSPAASNVVYLLTCNLAGGVNGIYKSTNSGASFSVVNSGSPSGMLGYFSDGTGGSGGQGSYDWCIAVDPTDADIVYIGGITTWKSTDGGSSFSAINCWTSSTFYNKPPQVPVVHADKHALAFQNNTTLFEGNDGGIYKTTNGGSSWTDLSNGMVISQLYRIGISQSNPTLVMTGLQDNGSKLYNTGSWSDVKGGDGMECIIDYSNPNYMYATYVRGQITRTTDGWQNWWNEIDISANIPGGQPTGAWVTPYIIDPNNSSTIIAAYDSVWKTTNRGNTWTGISQELSNNTKLRSLAIAPSNSNVLYTADRTNMWKTTNGGATNWTSITLPTTSNYLTYIAVKNNDPNTIWITFGGYTSGSKVYESSNGGASWTNISNGLPNLPVMCIEYYKEATDRNVLFVGTDVGVYVKDGTNNWVPFNNGLPNVVVTELEVLYAAGTDNLRAGTHGRGLWETEIDAALPVELVSFEVEEKNNLPFLNWQTETEVNNYGFEIERSQTSDVRSQTTWEKIGFVEGSGNSNSPKFYSFKDDKPAYGNISYRLKQIDTDGTFDYSDIVEIEFHPTEFSLNQNYPNPFNPETTIEFLLPLESNVKLNIYNSLGEKVEIAANDNFSSGKHLITWNGSDYSSGIYYFEFIAKENSSGRIFRDTKKMVLMK